MGYRKLWTVLLTALLVFTMVCPAVAEQGTNADNSANEITDDVVAFYYENKDLCDEALEYYNGYESNLDQYVSAPKGVISEDDFLEKLQYDTVLVMTVNPIERGVFLRCLSEKVGQPLETYQVGNLTCNVCNVENRLTIIHVNPGKTGEEYTRRAINRITSVVVPDYICLVGICYGINMEKNTIGDVLISDRVKTFRLNFRDRLDSDEIRFEVEEEYDAKPSETIVQRIRDRLMYTRCNNILTIDGETYPAHAEVGLFLSCNSLMSSSKVKQAITEQYTLKGAMPLGGEMEGAGLLKSSIVEMNRYDNWLIVKSICDWGEKKNALDPDPVVSEYIKDCLQAYAMTNTCGVWMELIKSIF